MNSKISKFKDINSKRCKIRERRDDNGVQSVHSVQPYDSVYSVLF